MGYNYTSRNGQRVEVGVAADFDRLNAAFKQAFGLDLIVSSGTRTRAEQQYLYNGWINRLPGFNLAAPPGSSNHEESGPVGPIALDIRDTGRDAGVLTIGSVRNNWIRDNGPTYGFELAGLNFNPKEPWHIERRYPGGKGGSTASVDNVVTLEQNFLNVARGEHLAVDGIRGPATIAAYKRYQEFLRAYGYTGAIDGIWGGGTQAAHAKFYAEWDARRNQSTKSPKSAGELNYADIQTALNKHGYGLAVDGIWGPKSSNALADFQRRNGLVVDRLVGPATWSKLNV
ncbi:lysin A [Microbacterium phage Armstrong]|uniref:Endolysin n=1 Tax=Microbacterium phage Armstrong TaxID=2419971 RepID=A0A3G2KD16_9CAUD|nr:lysin A [Microbacterium phage Armstrong]AYN56906.1 endolysin [Microbacterium phage Armstrong]UOK18173.1 endolysin [Microbacterium phage Clayda5]